MSTPLLENILNQPAALKAVAQHHLDSGRDALSRAATLLTSAKRVIISGMGASFFASLPFAYRLSARRLCVLTVESSELLYFLDAQIDAGTLVLLVSRSGESIEVAKLVPEIHRRGASVLGITNDAESTLGRGADQTIAMASPLDELVAIQTYTSTLATLALLDAAIDGELDNASRELEETAATLSHWIPECVRERERWVDFLDSNQTLYLLGRGPTTASFLEGALLMHETAKFPTMGMSVAQFRHGPVEVVDQDFRAIVWGTQRATAVFDAALASDLAHMGGQVRWIGPVPPDSAVTVLCHWPTEIPERFTSITEIIPLQLLAYKKAEMQGLRPGHFRWSSAITASETGFPLASL